MRSAFIKAIVQTVGASFMIGVLYLIGLNFYGGYCEIFGLDESQFPIAVDRILYYGFFAFTLYASLSVKAAFIAAGLFIGFALLQFLLTLWLVYYNRNLPLEDIKEKEIKTTLLRQITREAFGPAYYSYYIVIGIFIFGATLFILFLATEGGHNFAFEFLERIEKGEIASVDIYLSDQPADQPVKGHPINWLCNATHCAFLI